VLVPFIEQNYTHVGVQEGEVREEGTSWDQLCPNIIPVTLKTNVMCSLNSHVLVYALFSECVKLTHVVSVCPSVHLFHLRYYSKDPIKFDVRGYNESCWANLISVQSALYRPKIRLVYFHKHASSYKTWHII
jgi:hypothetical protein